MSTNIDDVTHPGGETSGITESDRHRLLAVERRRIAIDALADHGLPVETVDLAEMIAAREGDRVDDESVTRVAVELHHCHLPMMADLGVVDYDPGTGRVTALRASLEDE